MDNITVDIDSLAFGGRGVGRYEGKVCFVEGALPGEKVVFRVTHSTPRYMEGEITSILETSPYRTEPECPYYGECGGCHLQHISYERELFHKREQILDLMRRIGGEEDIRCVDDPSPGRPYGYRSSVTLHVSAGAVGLYGRKSHDVVPIKRCPVADEAINAFLAGPEMKITPSGDVTLKSDLSGKVWSSRASGERFFRDICGGHEIYFSPKAFSQPNRHVAGRIAETLGSWIDTGSGKSAFFDVYCGIGYFGFALDLPFDVIVGSDSSRVAVDCAKTTARSFRDGRFKFYRGRSEKVFREIFGRNRRDRNIVFLDPPRTGVPRAFLEGIRDETQVDAIYYLSCDAARLARDTSVITEGNKWRLGRVTPFDMFPRTYHIETLAEFLKDG